MVVSNERREIIGPRRIEGAPDLILEVLSPSTREVDQVRKAALYARSSVREYWQVDPEARAITVYRLHGQHFEPIPQPPGFVQSQEVTGLEIELAPLFTDLAEADSGGASGPAR